MRAYNYITHKSDKVYSTEVHYFPNGFFQNLDSCMVMMNIHYRYKSFYFRIS